MELTVLEFNNLCMLMGVFILLAGEVYSRPRGAD